MVSLRILIADDQLPEVEETARQLSLRGHHVETITSYSQALERARDEAFDVAIIDLGWYTDPTLATDAAARKGELGWAIDDAVCARSPHAIRILFTSRAAKSKDSQSIIEAAARRNMLLVKKYDSSSAEHLAATAVFAAEQVAIIRRAQTVVHDVHSVNSRMRRGICALLVALSSVALIAFGLLAATADATATVVMLGAVVAASLGVGAFVLRTTGDFARDDVAQFLRILPGALNRPPEQ